MKDNLENLLNQEFSKDNNENINTPNIYLVKIDRGMSINLPTKLVNNLLKKLNKENTDRFIIFRKSPVVMVGVEKFEENEIFRLYSPQEWLNLKKVKCRELLNINYPDDLKEEDEPLFFHGDFPKRRFFRFFNAHHDENLISDIIKYKRLNLPKEIKKLIKRNNSKEIKIVEKKEGISFYLIDKNK